MTMTKLCFLINCRQHLCWGVQPIRNRQVHICKQRCFKEGMSARNQLISQIYYGTLQNTETKNVKYSYTLVYRQHYYAYDDRHCLRNICNLFKLHRVFIDPHCYILLSINYCILLHRFAQFSLGIPTYRHALLRHVLKINIDQIPIVV